MSRPAWILLLALSVLWGGSYLAFRVSAPQMPALTLVLARCLIAAVALHTALLLRGRRLRLDRGRIVDYGGMGLLNNVIPFGLIFYGTQTITAGLASILNAVTPMITALVFHLFTRDERLTANKGAGVVLGFAGVAILLGPAALTDAGDHLLAELACIGATVSYAFSTLWARRFRGDDPMEAACGQLTASTTICLPLALLVDRPWTLPMPGADVVAAVLFLGLFATALAYVIFFRILTLAGSNVMLVTLLVPVSAVVLGALVLGERLEPRAFAGMAVIAIGLAAIDGRLWRRIVGARVKTRIES
jgi:drug/metabolite transporter (DMT)-like permease